MSNVSYVLNESLKTNGKADYIVYTQDNPLKGAGTGLHGIRTTGEKVGYLPHMTDSSGNIVGVFDQTIQLYTNYDVACLFYIAQSFYIPNVGIKLGKTLVTKPIPAGEQSILFTPYETTDNTNEKIITIKELNHPTPFFRIGFSGFATAPTTGDTVLAVTRRF